MGRAAEHANTPRQPTAGGLGPALVKTPRIDDEAHVWREVEAVSA